MLRLKTILQYKYPYIIFFFFSLLISFLLNLIPLKSNYNINDNYFTGILLDKKIDGNKLTFTIKNDEKIKCSYYLKSEEEKEYYKLLDLGVTLNLKGVLSEPINNTIPNTFNYKKYLNNNKIKYTLTVEEIKVSNFKTNIFYNIKNNLIKYINTFKSRIYLNTFIIGIKDEMDAYKTYQKLGVSHIFAISGMHVSMLTGIILFILKKLKVKESIAYISVILFLLLFLFLTNYQASILRSVGLFILLFINKKLKLDIDVLNILLFDISILLLINPTLINNVGFIYSSVVSFSLIKYNHYITGNYFMKILKVSLIAFLFSLPITLYNNYEFNLLSILNNIIIVPFVSLFLYPLCILTLIIKPLDNILFIIINLLEKIITKLFIFNIIIPKINIFIIIIYYLFLLLFFKSYKKIFLIFIVILLTVYKCLPYLDKAYYIYFLDVGQGDSIVIKKGFETIMIDTGGKVDFEEEEWKKREMHLSDNSIKFLKSIGVSKINYLILTHGDKDHAGEASYLINNFKVLNVILNKGQKNELEKLIDDNLIKTNYDGNMSFLILDTNIYNDENSNSIISLLNAYNKNIIFMGDAPKEVELSLLDKYNLNIDLIKIAHHGSKTSSDETFLNNIGVKEAVISSGRNNRYNHPDKETLEVLDNLNINYLNTQECGTIEYKITKKMVTKYTFPP